MDTEFFCHSVNRKSPYPKKKKLKMDTAVIV